ncbi:MAG: T9SS type A sorting domain-containing protein [Saprospiraceae bacterium]
MLQKLHWLAFPMLVPVFLNAQTWANEIAPIFYQHCVSCHRAGGVGAFPLETWSDAQNNAAAILTAVESRYMPPWRADPAYRHFKDENYLSDTEIATIAAWVGGDQLPGDLSQAPPLPNFQNDSQLSSVDMSLLTPEYTVAQNTDEYRAFAIPTGVGMDKFFNEIEILPGNDAIIHHIVLYTDPTNEPLLLDQADPGPGFKTNGMVGNITQNAELIGEWTPGGTPIKLPANFGYRIPKNGYFIFEIHFAPGHQGQTDAGSAINLHFSTNFNREVYYGVLTYGDNSSGLVNPPFMIPANTERTLLADLPTSWLSPVPLSVLSLTPHAHVVAKSFKAYSYRPGFTDTIPLIDVPKWDFHWQGTYTLRKPLRLNTNRTTRAEVVYDNTVNNPENPFDPPQDVWWGEKTSDEMLYLFASVVTYKTGDENIILDSTLLVGAPEVVALDEGFRVGPNPVDDVLDIRSAVPVVGLLDLLLTDMQGRVCRQWRERDLIHSRTSVRDLAPGLYVLHIRQPGRVSTYKVLKM